MAGSSVIHAPEIDRPGLTWFNVPEPLGLERLRGKLVILDFWTFCCINCIHVIPILRRIEERFPEEVVVIGVHSPKFAAERDPHNVREAIRRYGIVHPVVHDPEMALWRAYAVRAWPTLVFVGPDGYVLGQAAGEPDPEALEATVARVLEEARRVGVLSPSPLALAPEADEGGALSFPGKLKPVPGDGPHRWALADAGHHQIVLLDDAGRELRRFGDGRAGLVDGTAEAARFTSPQGLIAAADAVYVADTGNHAIRRIDLATGAVSTLAGTGRRGPALRGGAAPAAGAALASPWDLELRGRRLFFANAGTHQLGELDLDALTVQPLAGTGGEDIRDGPAAEALLAQPSGLALDPSGVTLYFADSETSAVRAVSLGGTPPWVTTLVGVGLFDFGHRNGPFEQARLQHPLGVAWHEGGLLVADSYNGEVRRLDLARREVGDLDGGRFTCQDPVCLPLGEPAGVASAGPGRVLLVDTNNHRVLEYRLDDLTYRTWLR